jgi:hypothetical protein
MINAMQGVDAALHGFHNVMDGIAANAQFNARHRSESSYAQAYNQLVEQYNELANLTDALVRQRENDMVMIATLQARLQSRPAY